jgi:heme exporter protein A
VTNGSGDVTAAPIAIATSQLRKDFGRHCVLRGIDLAIPVGQCVALTGANGAGKTTLLRCLAALIRPTSGEVLWWGRPVRDESQRRLIGMVAHESRTYPHLTLRENLLFAARMCDVPHPADRVDWLLREVGLADRAGWRPREISRGLQQRLALARALVHQPPVLLLDEPFSGLDAAGSQWLCDTLRPLCQRGRTVCFTSHDPLMTAQLADVIYELQSGRLHGVERRWTSLPADAARRAA